MGQTKTGAIITAAKKLNLTVDQYLQKSTLQKHCTKCKEWVDKSNFHNDLSRFDNLASICKNCRKSKNPYQSLKGRESTFKGKKHTQEAKQKISLKNKGKTSPMKGKNHSLETKMKISKTKRETAPRGKNCQAYKDGKLSQRRGLRFSREYKNWRYDVFSRDNFTCQKCNDNKGGNLNAHHIKAFADFPELRFELTNGITLCEKCHKKEHQK